MGGGLTRHAVPSSDKCLRVTGGALRRENNSCRGIEIMRVRTSLVLARQNADRSASSRAYTVGGRSPIPSEALVLWAEPLLFERAGPAAVDRDGGSVGTNGNPNQIMGPLCPASRRVNLAS